jgi:methanogenic corrinoid protein MtbC1
MRELCDSGMAASEAARIALEGPADSSPKSADPFEKAAERLVEATTSFDTALLFDHLRWSLTLGDAVTVYERVIAPALHRVGDLWEAGRVSVGQEHLFSDAVEYALRDLLRLVQPADAEASALLACFPDELHTLGLYGVGVRLCSLGVRNVVLGARTPPAAVHHAVARVRPTFVGLSVTVPPRDPPARLVKAYAEAVGDTPWMVGGAQAESMRDLVDASGGRVIAPWPDGIHTVVREILRAR